MVMFSPTPRCRRYTSTISSISGTRGYDVHRLHLFARKRRRPPVPKPSRARQVASGRESPRDDLSAYMTGYCAAAGHGPRRRRDSLGFHGVGPRAPRVRGLGAARTMGTTMSVARRSTSRSATHGRCHWRGGHRLHRRPSCKKSPGTASATSVGRRRHAVDEPAAPTSRIPVRAASLAASWEAPGVRWRVHAAG